MTRAATDEERRATFELLKGTFDPEDEKLLADFERFQQITEGLPCSEITENRIDHARKQAVLLAVAALNVDDPEPDLICETLLHAFRAHRCLGRIAQRQRGAP